MSKILKNYFRFFSLMIKFNKNLISATPSPDLGHGVRAIKSL
jgi:hypothetical protein